MRYALIGLLWVVTASAQVGTFHAPITATVNASANTTLTIQQPATASKTITFVAAIVQCPGQSFSVAQAYNGAGATTTAATVLAMATTSTNTTNTALAFSASNVGAGTSALSTLVYTSGAIAVLDLTKPGVSMTGNGITKNYSVTLVNTGSVSCAATLDIIWQEQ